MDIKHTLPWGVTDGSVIVDRTGRAILHSSLRDERPGERVAIARLAAAAPDLLAACEAARDALNRLNKRDDAYIACCAAIARATGSARRGR